MDNPRSELNALLSKYNETGNALRATTRELWDLLQPAGVPRDPFVTSVTLYLETGIKTPLFEITRNSVLGKRPGVATCMATLDKERHAWWEAWWKFENYLDIILPQHRTLVYEIVPLHVLDKYRRGKNAERGVIEALKERPIHAHPGFRCDVEVS